MYLFFSNRGKRTAFANDVLQHCDGLYRYALKLTKNEQEAEDLVQETLMKAFRSYSKTNASSNYRAWAFTILRNEFISRKRRSRREVSLDDVTSPEKLISENTLAKPFADDWRQNVADDIHQALDRLGEVHRSVIVLCDIEGLTYEEISHVMQCPIGTVRSRVFHARRMLRESLKTYAKTFSREEFDEAM